MTNKDRVDKLITHLNTKANATAKLYNDPYDNCLLCKHVDILPNEVAKALRKLGLTKMADNIDASFPVVKCKASGGRYVVNPMSKPGWCQRK
jgi:hypothetical protein